MEAPRACKILRGAERGNGRAERLDLGMQGTLQSLECQIARDTILDLAANMIGPTGIGDFSLGFSALSDLKLRGSGRIGEQHLLSP